MAIEDEDYPDPAVGLGPLTKMNMERRAAPKHADSMAQPWESAEVAFHIQTEKLLNYGDCSELIIQLPKYWHLKSIGDCTSSLSKINRILTFGVRGSVTFSDGAQVRAYINLLK